MRAHIALCVSFAILNATAALAAPDWKAVGQALGREGATQGEVYRVGLPRSDLKVRLDGVDIKPALALGSWLAFQPMGDGAMVMGDLVLTQDEINSVMKKLSDGGIAITAIHNHLLRAEPFTLYMHVSGHGDPVKLATLLHDGLALSKTPLGPSAPGAAQSLDFDQPAIEKALGQAGKVNGGVLQFFRSTRRSGQRHRHESSRGDGFSDCDQPAIVRQWKGRGDRRFCAYPRRGEPCAESAAREWHRGNSPAQSHAR